MRKEQRQGGAFEHALGGSPQNEFPKTRVPIGSHDQKISIPVGGMSFDMSVLVLLIMIWILRLIVGSLAATS